MPTTDYKGAMNGIYVTHAPLGSGSIVLSDPRGPAPPYDNRLSFRPLEGQLIVYPAHVQMTVGQSQFIGDQTMTFWRLRMVPVEDSPLRTRVARSTSRSSVAEVDRAGIREALSGSREEVRSVDEMLEAEGDAIDDIDIDEI